MSSHPARGAGTPAGGRHSQPQFPALGFLAASELRRIRQRHEQFVRSLAARLAIFLRLEFSLQLEKVHIESYQKFIETLSHPTLHHALQHRAVEGRGFAGAAAASGADDRGPPAGRPRPDAAGQPGPDGHRGGVERPVGHAHSQRMVQSLAGNARPARHILGHENNSKFLQTSPPDTSMLVLNVAATIAEQTEKFQMIFPYTALEPLMRLLNPQLSAPENAPQRAGQPRWNAGFDEVKVPLTVEWQGLKMSAGDITRLKAGDLLGLDPACAAQVVVRLGSVPKFYGRPGTSDAKWAVQLTAPITP